MKPDTTNPLNRTDSTPWTLKLFVAPNSPASATAILQANYIVAQHLPKGSTLEIIDVSREVDIAIREQVLAIPTLVRNRPQPVRRIVGDLSDSKRVLSLLGILLG